MKRTTFPVLVFALLASVDAIFLFARAATQSGTWPLGIYRNQTITMKNFNTEDNYGEDSDGVGEILFDASLTSLTKGELILGSTNHANAADGTHNVGAKINALQAEQDSIMVELNGLTPPSPPPSPGMWITAVALSDNGSAVTEDIGESEFNDIFMQCPIVKYTRNGALHSIYHRTTVIPSDFNAYSLFTYTWKDTNNVLGTDFEIYDTYDDLLEGSNEWTFCNYNDPDVGYPRDCGKQGGVDDTWFSMPGDRFSARGLTSGKVMIT